jgi:hypothetical protein
VVGVPAQDHPDPAVGIDHPVAGGRAAQSGPMPKGAVPTDPDGRREAVNVPVAAVRAPDGDQHRAGIVPVREAVEHHRGVGGSYRHRDRLSGSTGKYTIVVQIVAKTDHEMNFVRSAMDSEINAGGDDREHNWKAAKTIVGTWSPCAPNVVVAAVARPSQLRLRCPHKPLDGSGEVADAVPAAPNARVNPYSATGTGTGRPPSGLAADLRGRRTRRFGTVNPSSGVSSLACDLR